MFPPVGLFESYFVLRLGVIPYLQSSVFAEISVGKDLFSATNTKNINVN